MNIEFRLPQLTAKDSAGQIRQLHSFLRQTVQQLNWAMQSLNAQTVQQTAQQASGRRAQAVPSAKADPAAESVEQFNTIKGLIIKSADIVNAYYTKIDALLSTSGKYVAQSDFGTYQNQVTQTISAEADSLLQQIRRVEQITDSTSNAVKLQNSYIRYGAVGTTLDDTGLASEDAAGIEIGDYQSLEDNTGTVTNQRFARFTAYGLELFGADKANPVAYLSGNKLYITEAEIKGTLRLGGYLVDGSNGVAFKWVGRS